MGFCDRCGRSCGYCRPDPQKNGPFEKNQQITYIIFIAVKAGNEDNGSIKVLGDVYSSAGSNAKYYMKKLCKAAGFEYGAAIRT